MSFFLQQYFPFAYKNLARVTIILRIAWEAVVFCQRRSIFSCPSILLIVSWHTLNVDNKEKVRKDELEAIISKEKSDQLRIKMVNCFFFNIL